MTTVTSPTRYRRRHAQRLAVAAVDDHALHAHIVDRLIPRVRRLSLDRVDHVFDFTDADTLQHVRLAERLSLSGVVTRSGEPMTSATLWLTRPTGESVGTARTDASGHYLFPLPAPGWYILTAVDPDSDHAQSHQFLMGAQSTTLNFETASVPQAVSRS